MTRDSCLGPVGLHHDCGEKQRVSIDDKWYSSHMVDMKQTATVKRRWQPAFWNVAILLCTSDTGRDV